MNASRNARERARAELALEIKEEARRQLVDGGAQKLSLRAVARELGMASSALYRYYPSRDDLLTALIIDAYDSAGAAAEEAESRAPREPRARWRAVCHAVRSWAIAHPHEYALVYGSPVPGYEAPQTTIGPASRVTLVLVSVVRSADLPPSGAPLSPALAAQAEAILDEYRLGIPPQVLIRALIAWTQLFGMIGFELFGHLVGSVDPSEEFFTHTVERMADFLGFPADG